MVTRGVVDIDYEVVRSDRGEATQIYHLNLLKEWREADTASLVSSVKDRDELEPSVPNSTIALAYPMSQVDKLLDQLGTACFFTMLDLTKGYWHIRLSPESTERNCLLLFIQIVPIYYKGWGLLVPAGERG